MADINPIYLIALIAVMGLLPFFLMMVTSYVNIVVVMTLVRNALGVQQVPPTMVMNGLAIVLTVFIMGPVGFSTWDILKNKNMPDNPTPTEIGEILHQASPPLKNFLQKNSDPKVLNTFQASAKKIWPPEHHQFINSDNMMVLMPSFVISELTRAFKIGFLLYLPFITIDLIISNILLAMGMMMVSPTTISLPFKLLLFVTLDGWLKISQGLMYSYQ
ncbi:EscR/YscR/HrcR family type III secretion system export apparatus protein [Deltaproteobacteria bacterium Smac51]|nr:EscR/YscR/HrcR family type III secretion system export apparatus protein [Deltaproteobacteria bacterium Smac51]